MNLKELIVPLAFAILATMALQYFFFSKKVFSDGPRAGQSFMAPTGAQEAKPLNTEIDFLDCKRPAPAVLTQIDTDKATLVFSTDGASLERLEFKRSIGKRPYTIDTIFPPAETDRENRCFLTAFDQKTPYYYTLVDRKDLDVTTILTYSVETDEGVLTKTFTIYKYTYQIDLDIKISPKKPETIGQLRVLIPSPLMPELGVNDLISAVIGGDQGKITKIARTSIDIHQGWFSPSLFGTDSRYFVHAMINDPQAFCRRAYYKFFDKMRMMSILEGPALEREAQWRLSFYCGPKDLQAMIAVDSRLEQTLDYSGIMGPFAKWFLMVLNWLYSYLHSYGWAIIVLTLLMKLALLPMTLKAEAGVKKQKEFQKKLEYVKQKYKNEPERAKQEQADLIAKHGLPGLSGCLPILLQIPLFYILSRVLSSSMEMYRAPFLWIPDLAARDPWYILPLLTTGCMLAMLSATTDSRQQLTSIAMAVIIGAVSTSLSAGLALYIFMSTFLSLVQSFIQKRVT